MGLINWTLSSAIVLYIVFFAVMNQDIIEVTIMPFFPPVSFSLSILVLLSAVFGALFGGAFIWFEHGPLSKKADKKRAQVYDLIKENKKIKEEQEIREEINRPLIARQK